MSDIRQWLEELRLGQYADGFEENDIWNDVLPARPTDYRSPCHGVILAGVVRPSRLAHKVAGR